MDFVKGASNKVEPNILGNIYVPQQPAPAPQAEHHHDHRHEYMKNDYDDTMLKQYAAVYESNKSAYPQQLLDVSVSHLNSIKQHLETTVGKPENFDTAAKLVIALEREADRFMNAAVTDAAKQVMASMFLNAIADANEVCFKLFNEEKKAKQAAQQTTPADQEAIAKEQAELDEMMAELKKHIRFRKEYHKNGLTRNEMLALQKFVGTSANKKFVKALKANGVSGELTLKEVFNGRTKDGFDTAFRVKGSESTETATLFLNMKAYKGKNMPKYEIKFENSNK
jgi:hypothetical protein